jgi:hypothetical protein
LKHLNRYKINTFGKIEGKNLKDLHISNFEITNVSRPGVETSLEIAFLEAIIQNLTKRLKKSREQFENRNFIMKSKPDQILDNGDIVLNGKATQYSVKQSAAYTVVIDMTARKPVPMPQRKYDLDQNLINFFNDLKARINHETN